MFSAKELQRYAGITPEDDAFEVTPENVGKPFKASPALWMEIEQLAPFVKKNPKLPSVRELNLRGAKSKKGQLAPLAAFSGLEILSCPRISRELPAKDLSVLATLACLRCLDIGGGASNESSALSREKLVAVAAVKSLVALDLSFSGFEPGKGGVLTPLQDLPALRMLGLDGLYPIDDMSLVEAFAAVAGLPELVFLSIYKGDSWLTDQALAGLAKTKLQHVALPMSSSRSSGGVTDAGIKELAKIESLRSVDVMDSPKVGTKGLTALAARPLTALAFGTTWRPGGDMTRGIDDKALDAVGACTTLEELTFEGCAKVTEKGFARIGGLERLRRLRVEALKNVTIAGLTKVVAKLEHLEELEIGEDVDDKLVAAIAGLPLKRLQLKAGALTSAGYQSLAKITSLETLEVSSCAAKPADLEALTKLKAPKDLTFYYSGDAPEGVTAPLKKAFPKASVYP